MTTLEDLRKANLKEQRGGGTPVIAKPEPVAAKPEPVVEKAVKAEVVETPLISDLTEHGLTIEPVAEPAPVAPTPVQRAVAPVVVRETLIEAVVVTPAAPVVDPLVERMRVAVLRKRLIPAGVKTTVDMSPELFWRAKKYCHDHSNSTLRQLMLEILAQFLEEEGY